MLADALRRRSFKSESLSTIARPRARYPWLARKEKDYMDDLKNILVRTSTENDAEFAFRAVKETMRDYAIATWGSWHEDGSLKDAIADTKSGKTQIIELDGTPVGVLQVERFSTHLQLNQIYILPDFQNRKIGSLLIRELILRAKNEKLPLRLRVLAVNPAKKLYEKMGFVVYEETKEIIFMEIAP